VNQEDWKVLLIGYGNPGRLDDGLGPALVQVVDAMNLPGVTAEAAYQLTVEDAAELRGFHVVVFADADVAGPEPFWVRRIVPDEQDVRPGFSSHSVEPQAVLALAKELFAAQPEAYVLGIRGYEFNEFGERLSPRARANLAAATVFVASAVERRTFREIRAEQAQEACPVDPSNEEDPCKTENT